MMNNSTSLTSKKGVGGTAYTAASPIILTHDQIDTSKMANYTKFDPSFIAGGSFGSKIPKNSRVKRESSSNSAFMS